MTRLIATCVALLLAFGSSQAMAQRDGKDGRTGPRSREAVQKRLTALFDRNHDGRLDRREWRAAKRALRELRPDGKPDAGGKRAPRKGDPSLPPRKGRRMPAREE